jgi:putative redox protein
MKRRTERVRFEGAFGDQPAARVDLPPGEPRAIALFAHCFTCSKDLKPIVRISRALAERGIGVVRFDFTGIGESAGDFADTNFTSNLEDLVAAAGFVRREYDGPQLLIGHSLGGAAVLAAAHRVPEARLVATIAAPSDTGHLSETLLRHAPELEEEGEAEVVLAGRRVRIRRQLIDDLDQHSMSSAVAALDRPLILFHSPADKVIDIEHAHRIFEMAKHPKSLVSLGGADHLLLENREDAIFVADILATWTRRYLEPR